MFGIIVSLIAVLSPRPAALARPAAPAAAGEMAVICDQLPSSCDAAAADQAPADQPDIPVLATPALVDCPAPVVALFQGLVGEGECDGTTRNLSYRASRDPENERSPGSVRPARRERSRSDSVAACDGIPSEGGDTAHSVSASQPLALFALPDLPRFISSRLTGYSSSLPPSRQLRPLERPPRA